MRKPTPAMLEVLRMMANGWELGLNAYPGGQGYWMQRGGLGRGGPAKGVNSNTASGLLQRGLFTLGEGFPTRPATLTETGRKIAEAKP